jgi:plasmid stability protein
MKTKPKDKMKMLVARVPEEVHKAIKVRSAEEGKSIAVVVEGLIRAYLVKGDLLDRRKSWGLDAEEVGAGVKEMTKGAAHE